MPFCWFCHEVAHLCNHGSTVVEVELIFVIVNIKC